MESQHSDSPEIVDLGQFQKRLQVFREKNREAFEQTPAEWARRVADIQQSITQQRLDMEEALLQQMLEEEEAMLVRLEDMERNLRNTIRIYKQLMDERNAMVAGIDKLHRWIRQVEAKQKREPHRDHATDLGQKYFVEFLSKTAWIFDNQKGWDLEETPRRRRASSS